jgi:D-alanyl-D-alanine carboxypeptidase
VSRHHGGAIGGCHVAAAANGDDGAMTSRRPFGVLLLGAVVLAPALAACSDTSATENQLDPDERLDQALGELVAMPGGPPGAIVVVQRGSDRSVHAAGVAEVGAEDPPDVDDHMRLASVAKAFSGATALSLVDEGVLSLDDTIADRLPDLPAAWGEVTLRQLLNHTSGLPDFTESEAFFEEVTASLEEAVPPVDMLAFVAEEPLNFPPGTQYRYSNSDNITVGLMIEAATGQSYEDVLAQEVLEPLGLDDTSLPAGTELPEPYMHGYRLNEEGQPVDESNVAAAGWAWASGGIVSTPADLNDFIRGYVGGELFGDDVREEQQDLFIPGGLSDPNGPGDGSASMALFRYQTECGTVYGHSGNIFGYTQFAVASPDGRRSVTSSISLQRTQKNEGQDFSVYEAQVRLWEAAICAAFE